MMRECIECGTAFEATHFNTKVCSAECRRERKYRYRRGWRENKKTPITPTECIHCGTEFTSTNRQQTKFCSTKCSSSWWKAEERRRTVERRARISPRKCAGCDLSFTPSMCDDRIIYCSHDCNLEHAKKKKRVDTKRRQAQLEERCCATCEKKFKPRRAKTYKSQKYCSTECSFNHLNRRLSNNVACQVRKALRARGMKKSKRTFPSLGYDVHQLASHLESQFVEGMSWDNMGEWHIDHVRPKSTFTFTSMNDPEFKACWALENLQPLWATDNLSKGAKWEGLTDAEA